MTTASRILPLTLLLLGCRHGHDALSDLGASDAATSDAATTSALDAAGDPSWMAARIASPIPYDAPEHADVVAPQPLAGGKVVYESAFADGSWHLVVQNEDGTGATSLLESTSVPGFTVASALAVPEASGVIVLLRSNADLLPSVLEVVPLAGGAPVMIDESATGAVVTADGTRVVYLTSGATATDPPVVRISSITSPSPQTLGLLDAGATLPGSGGAITRSSSAASSTPFFYLGTTAGETSPCTARAFGTVPANVPASIQFTTTNGACGVGSLLDGSANGRFVKVDHDDGTASLVDAQTGSVSASARIVFSPDHTRWLVVGTTTVTIYAQDGTSVTATISASSSVSWSADSTALLVASSGTDVAYSVVTAATGAVATSGTSSCPVTTLLSDHLHAVSIAGGNVISVVDLSTGTCTTLTTVPSYALTFVDTGDGVVFPDGWGAYYVKYDGTGRTRLDTPRTGEVTLGAGTVIEDSDSGASGPLSWDAATGTVLFQPVTDADEALSVESCNHAIATTKLAAPATVLLTTGTKQTGQIEGFEQNFALFPKAGKVLFDSADGSRGEGVIPCIVSVGSLTGGSAAQLGSLPASGVYGGGEFGRVGVLGGASAQPASALYTAYAHETGFDLEVQALDGSAPTTFAGYELRLTSPDGTLAFVTNAENAGYVVSTSPTSTAMPTLVSGTISITEPSACLGCDGSDTTVYTDGSGWFTADDKLVLNGVAQGASAASTFYVDPAASSAPVDLAITNALLLPDGLTVAGNASDGSMVVFPAATPAQRTSLGEGFVVGASSDGTTLVFVDSITANPKALSSVTIASGQVTSLVPASMMSGGTLYDVSVSADGTRVFAEYIVGLSTPGACGAYARYGFASNLDGTNAIVAPHPCGVGRVYPTGDYTGLVYLLGNTLYAGQGASPLPLTETTERATNMWLVPGTSQVIVRTLDSNGVWHLIAIHADGTKRAEIGDGLPFQKQVIDVQFDPGHVVIDTDAITDGRLELFRFVLPD